MEDSSYYTNLLIISTTTYNSQIKSNIQPITHIIALMSGQMKLFISLMIDCAVNPFIQLK